MKILLLYATRHGQTEKIAARLKTECEHDGASVTQVNITDRSAVAELELTAFDLLVFGASIHIGTIEKSLASFINIHRDAIEVKPHSMFIVLMAAASRDAVNREKSLVEVREKVAKQLLVKFTDIEMIAGAIKYTKYNWFIRWVMKGIAKKEGGSIDISKDHEYTDWDQVAAYARRLVG